jgi:Tol biopolymer transport system component
VGAALPVSSTARSVASGRDGILYRTVQIWVQNLVSKQAHRLTSGRGAFAHDWSPDGRRIALARGGRIAVVDADGRRITRAAWGTNTDPDW